ncbi:MAG: pyruvate dehydrogenase complex dihydrolipoamide acetyltransferase [Rickettsiales bacterium]
MPIEVLMPALSPTMKDGNIVKWNKKEGDAVSPGEVIAEIETDKATMEVEAVDEGKIGRIVHNAGSKAVKVNSVIALLLEEGEDKAALDKHVFSDAGNDNVPAAAPEKSENKEQKAAPASTPQAASFAPPPPAFPLPAQQSSSSANANHYNGERVKASPLAKRIAEELGVDVSRIRGTGPNGRVVKADVEDAARYGLGGNVVARNAQEYTAKENSGMRRTIAARLLQSKQYVPHFYLTVDCELDALLDVRAQINDEADKSDKGEPSYKLSVNDLIVKAVALALKKNPNANCTWNEETTVYYNNVDISVAVAIDGGLITPIVRNADQKSVVAISQELKDLIKRAKTGKLAPEEYQGGGFSISNLGMFGIKQFSAIINPPQSCILAVGSGEERAVVKNGKVVPAIAMTVTLSCDHRTVDGAVGAGFLQSFKKYVERPAALLL